MSLESLTRKREEAVDGYGPWVWPSTDNGAWDGPKTDWETSHKFKFMQYLKDTRGIITAGANCGMYARIYSHLFETVWAFEPEALNFYCLVQNAQRENVIKMQAALGSKNSTIAMVRHDMTNVGMHTVSDSVIGSIPLITIDSLNLPYCSLIQLDVEGYEIEALRGGLRTIDKYRPIVAAERGETEDITKFFFSVNYEKVDQSVSDTIWAPKS